MINKSMLALACGDSYGSHFEYDGLMGITFDIKKLPNKPKTIKITDDTKMAVILLNHYMKNETIDISKLFEEYREWAKRDGYADGIGTHTRTVLLEGETNKDSQGNGALMRVIPFGIQLIADGYSFKDVILLMNQDSSITHKNKTIFTANKLCLDIALNGLKVLGQQEYEDLLSRIHLGNTAWVIHSLYIVIEALKRDYGFVEGFKYIVSKGGDTDTNCAIYGAIRGFEYDIRKEIDIYAFLPKDFIKRIV